ncbi:hypothetical protein DPMN_024736 [Dreissena polymorpha]|uniref:Uncharacterized protein n=1 Tax=Dreissena polymorpha TaxID=45954 RepID=A0A9D4LPQ2_DREPO|nr:hypothetical protein DPMN_024736 [Dreissena polymorpha]
MLEKLYGCRSCSMNVGEALWMQKLLHECRRALWIQKLLHECRRSFMDAEVAPYMLEKLYGYRSCFMNVGEALWMQKLLHESRRSFMDAEVAP